MILLQNGLFLNWYLSVLSVHFPKGFAPLCLSLHTGSSFEDGEAVVFVRVPGKVFLYDGLFRHRHKLSNPLTSCSKGFKLFSPLCLSACKCKCLQRLTEATVTNSTMSLSIPVSLTHSTCDVTFWTVVCKWVLKTLFPFVQECSIRIFLSSVAVEGLEWNVRFFVLSCWLTVTTRGQRCSTTALKAIMVPK